jgi:transcriptional regulator with XRE-family HTH domain
MDMRKIVGDNFLYFRKSKGLTQEQVQERTGLSQQYLSDLERGKRNPTVVTIFELAQALGVRPADFLIPPADDAHADKSN